MVAAITFYKTHSCLGTGERYCQLAGTKLYYFLTCMNNFWWCRLVCARLKYDVPWLKCQHSGFTLVVTFQPHIWMSHLQAWIRYIMTIEHRGIPSWVSQLRNLTTLCTAHYALQIRQLCLPLFLASFYILNTTLLVICNTSITWK